MRSKILYLAFGLILASASAVNAADEFKNRTAQQDVACMIKVLKTLPRVDHIKTGFDMYGGARYRYVEYRYISKTGHDYGIIQFAARPNSLSDGHPDAYMATLANGVTEERPDGRPSKIDDMGTRRVMDQWKAHCGITTSVLSF